MQLNFLAPNLYPSQSPSPHPPCSTQPYLSSLHQHLRLLHRIPKENRPIEITPEDHRRRGPMLPLRLRLLTALGFSPLQHFHLPNLRSIQRHNFDPLRLESLLHSRPSLTSIEAHGHVFDDVGFEPRARDIQCCMRNAQVARGTDAEDVRDIVGCQFVG